MKPITEVELGEHGIKQLHARAGIPKRGAERHINTVLAKGVELCKHPKRRYRRWADWARNHYTSDYYYCYGDHIYGFDRQGTKLILVTVLYLPHSGAYTN